ncbi:hypothetical protein HPP92_026021 [Vanilla planifolia]|uniref:RING-type domain-containing protein n=1 Tax=Vanilla planifolia TaxID=51239 RepID=A0A835PNG6_VANPL|nr:hypothetical protein HPP92_026021 [Vanilla planifolia]
MKYCPSSLSKSSKRTAAAALACSVVLLYFLRSSSAHVHLRGESFSFTFNDAPASFAIPVEESGACGSLLVANPLDACSPLDTNSSSDKLGSTNRDRFVLIERGQCSFDRKVRAAQAAGFRAAIVFDDQDVDYLYSMVGNPTGIHIHAVFVSKMAGEIIRKYADGEAECCIGPPVEDNAGTILVLSFVSVAIIISIVATFVFARNCWILRNASRRCSSTMKKHEIEIFPCFTFKGAYLSSKHITETCAICLEDYRNGEKLRVLPCMHNFHSQCVDSWLTKWGTFCPICKHEMNQRG